MSQPKPEALAALAEFRRSGAIDLGPVRLDRRDRVGHVTLQNHPFLNAEDGAWAAALETAVDLVLLDDTIELGTLRGGPATHPKYAGRRVFSAGVNLTHLYWGRISLLDYMLDKELGAIAKMYRGQGQGLSIKSSWRPAARSHGSPRSRASRSAAAASCFLVVDHVVAETGSYFSLPARYEGIIHGLANLRLPRFVGERLTREAILFNTVSPPKAERGAADLLVAGSASLTANRKAQRVAAEPLDVFRRYMASYAREQALCMYSPALIDNLERNWNAKQRKP
jgi:thioesterase DpgC